MTKNKQIILIAVLVLGGLGILGAADYTEAYRGDYSQKGPYYNKERHQEMEKAFENNDYEAWKSLMNGRGRVGRVINAENFSRFSQAHQLAQEGKYEEANAIREELGLATGGNRSHQSCGNQNGLSRWQNQE